ncbi:MAG: phosphoribosylanthranilate isomerase [Pyrinomonadaceae bacterium]
MTRIKICGITNLTDARHALACGADELGFNFHPASPRFILPAEAAEICIQLPPNASKVGVFVNAAVSAIGYAVLAVRLDAVQLHGDESAEFVGLLRARIGTNVKIIKALRVAEHFDTTAASAFRVEAILLDAFSTKAYGGTGESLDWKRTREIRDVLSQDIYLAGGLSAENVAEAINTARPYAVDACSRLEFAPGIKDAEAVKNFVAAVREPYELRAK